MKMTKVNKIHQHHQLGNIHSLNINQIRNCRVRNINKHRPTEMYLTQFLITSAGTTVFLGHN
jgi:hypothetical protein